jgi:RES domain-containing protein
MTTRRARDPAVLDWLDAFRREDFSGIAWRVGREGRDPTQGHPSNGRWDPGTFDVLYTSLARDGALSEIFFHLSRQPVFPSKIKSLIHRLTINVTGLLRLDTLEDVARGGVDISRYGGTDYVGLREIGDAAYFLGFNGMIVPSARASCLNLVLFTERVAVEAVVVDATDPVDWNEWRLSRRH